MANWQRVWRHRLYKAREFTRLNRIKTKADLVRFLAVLGFFGIIGAFLMGTVLFAWYSRDLPQPDKVARRDGFSTKILDRNGELLYDVFVDQRRTPVKFDQMPEDLKKAREHYRKFFQKIKA